MTGPAAPYKERVAQPVQVSDNLRVDRLVARQGYTNSLGPPANGAANMQLGIQPATARQDERPQRRQAFVHFIYLGFKLRDLRFGDPRLPWMQVGGESRQNRANIEQLVLYPF